jgi:hypothetical protein
MFPGVRIPEYLAKLYNLITLDKLQYQKETFGSKARVCVHFEKMSFYMADINHSWPLSFAFASAKRNYYFFLYSPQIDRAEFRYITVFHYK